MTKKENLHIVLRVREEESRLAEKDGITILNRTKLRVEQCAGSPGIAEIEFDHIWGREATQRDIFTSIQSSCDDVVQGYNASIVSCGFSKSGKSYSLHGTTGVPGVIQHAMTQVFQNLEAMCDREFILELRCMKIHENELTDLLEPNCTVTVSPKSSKSHILNQMSHRRITSVKDALLQYRNAHRSQEAEENSVVSIRVISKPRSESSPSSKRDHEIFSSELVFLDLTGCSTLGTSASIDVDEMKCPEDEAQYHRSYSSHHQKLQENRFVKYLFGECIYGNYRTHLLVTLRCPISYQQQAIQTLMYACKMKCIEHEIHVEPLKDGQKLFREKKSPVMNQITEDTSTENDHEPHEDADANKPTSIHSRIQKQTQYWKKKKDELVMQSKLATVKIGFNSEEIVKKMKYIFDSNCSHDIHDKAAHDWEQFCRFIQSEWKNDQDELQKTKISLTHHQCHFQQMKTQVTECNMKVQAMKKTSESVQSQMDEMKDIFFHIEEWMKDLLETTSSGDEKSSLIENNEAASPKGNQIQESFYQLKLIWNQLHVNLETEMKMKENCVEQIARLKRSNAETQQALQDTIDQLNKQQLPINEENCHQPRNYPEEHQMMIFSKRLDEALHDTKLVIGMRDSKIQQLRNEIEQQNQSIQNQLQAQEQNQLLLTNFVSSIYQESGLLFPATNSVNDHTISQLISLIQTQVTQLQNQLNQSKTDQLEQIHLAEQQMKQAQRHHEQELLQIKQHQIHQNQHDQWHISNRFHMIQEEQDSIRYQQFENQQNYRDRLEQQQQEREHEMKSLAENFQIKQESTVNRILRKEKRRHKEQLFKQKQEQEKTHQQDVRVIIEEYERKLAKVERNIRNEKTEANIFAEAEVVRKATEEDRQVHQHEIELLTLQCEQQACELKEKDSEISTLQAQVMNASNSKEVQQLKTRNIEIMTSLARAHEKETLAITKLHQVQSDMNQLQIAHEDSLKHTSTTKEDYYSMVLSSQVVEGQKKCIETQNNELQKQVQDLHQNLADVEQELYLSKEREDELFDEILQLKLKLTGSATPSKLKSFGHRESSPSLYFAQPSNQTEASDGFPSPRDGQQDFSD